MGSEIQLEHCMPGYHSTRELGEEASSHAWNYYDRQFHGISVDLDCNKDEFKQKMLEHDAVFRRQVSELHRLYRTQRDLMDEMKRSEHYSPHKPLSINPFFYQRQDSTKMHSLNFPSSNSACTSPSIVGVQPSYPNLSHLKRKAPTPELVSAVDVDDSKDCEIIEYKPGKARRKMFDLQLSADAYTDPDALDQSNGLKAQVPNSSCDATSRSSNKGSGMKDLNEPIQIEDDLSTFNFMKTKTSGNGLHSKHFSMQTPPKSYSRETSFSSRYGGDNIDSKKQPLGYRENRVHASHQLSLGQLNTKVSSLTQYLQPESSQKPSHFMHEKYGMPFGTSIPALPNQSQDKFWKARVVYSSKFSDVGHEPRIQDLNHSSDMKCGEPPMASWEKCGGNSSQKQPYLISSVGLTKSSQASNQNMTSGYVVGIPRINELDHGSSLGSKEESICNPSVKFENHGSGKESAGVSGCSGNVASLKYSKSLSGFDLNSCEEMDLRTPVTNDSHHQTVMLLSWMKSKSFSSDNHQANYSQAQATNVFDLTKSAADHKSKHFNGFPVFSQPLTSGSFRLSNGHKPELKKNCQVFDMNMPCETDTNMEMVAADYITDKKVTCFKNFFDLNSCVTEDEVSMQSASSAVRNITGIDFEVPAPHKTDEDITFVATQQKSVEAELEHVAAEAMVLFYSLKKSNIMETEVDTYTETLKWFVGVVSSCPNENEQQNDELILTNSSEESDYFEQMTLNLTEMTEEECVPKNAFPTISNLEEEPVNAIVSARPRRGQARRGRQKRDFQRDILPNLTSLSRHEVTEDLQALDGLMRSSGYAWQYGKRAAVRNNPRRGRPRTVNIIPVPESNPIYPPPNHPSIDCIGVGMEEQNLTGWGKTIRRPRRQRCPTGNLQPARFN